MPEEFVNRFNVGYADLPSLDGVLGTTSVTVGARTFVYVAGSSSDEITAFELTTDGALVLVGTVDNAPLGGVASFATVRIDGADYIYANAQFTASVVGFRVNPDGTLTRVETIRDDGTGALELAGAANTMAVAQAGGEQFLVVGGYFDDGVSVFRLGAGGLLSVTCNIADTPQLGLNGAAAADTIRLGDRTFVVIAGHVDDAVNVFELDGDGVLHFIGSQVDTFDTVFDGPRDLRIATVDGTAYVIVSGQSDSGLAVFRLDEGGGLDLVFELPDDDALNLRVPSGIELFDLDGQSIVAVTSALDDALTCFRVGADGELTQIATVTDTAETNLNGALWVSEASSGGNRFLIVSSPSDRGLSVFEFDMPSAPLEGTEEGDFLQGSDRDDRMSGLAGDDVLTGAAGHDRIDGGGGSDVVQGDTGDDRLWGDGPLTVASAGQGADGQVLSLIAPQGAAGSEIEVSGFVGREAAGMAETNIVYVVDVSHSMKLPFGSGTVGDLNGNGTPDEGMDALIASFEALNALIADAGPTGANVTVIPFASTATAGITGTVDGGVEAYLRSLTTMGTTSFEAALTEAVRVLSGAVGEDNRVFFVSDGEHDVDSFLDAAIALRDPQGIDATIRAVGLGSDAALADLDLIDDGVINGSVQRADDPAALTAALTASAVPLSQVARLEILVNGTIRQTLLPAELRETPFGLRFDAVLTGMTPGAQDLIEARLVTTNGDTVTSQVTLSAAPPVPGNDSLFGGDGQDTIFGNAGDDRLFGGRGHDTLYGGTGHDSLFGEDGEDALLGGDGNDTLAGGPGNDTLRGGAGDDLILDGAGIDLIDGGAGLDTVSYAGGTGALIADLAKGVVHSTGDHLSGIENLIGTDRSDAIYGDAAANRLEGRGGADLVMGRAGDDLLEGGAGSDTLFGQDGDDTLLGGDEADTLSGGNGVDAIEGGLGDDLIFGGAGNDTLLSGGAGNDTISSGAGDDTGLSGGDGNDLVLGGGGNDWMAGDAGDDVMSGGGGLDTILGGEGADEIYGAAFDDDLDGGAGNDTVSGGTGNDVVRGGDGADQLLGAAGDDTLEGGAGNDTLTGGSGADTFVFAPGSQADLLGGFDTGADRLKFDDSFWTGTLSAEDVVNMFATQVSPGIVRFDFGDGDIVSLVNVNGVDINNLDQIIDIF